MSMLHSPHDLTLDELLEFARRHVITPEEKEAQRQSWVRGEMALGTDADEEAYKEKLRREGKL
jgi:hypothetical protein